MRSSRRATCGRPGAAPRIEHCQLLAPEDLPRFAELGIACSVQFSHAPSDRDVADRYWAGKTDGAYAFRSLLDVGRRRRQRQRRADRGAGSARGSARRRAAHDRRACRVARGADAHGRAAFHATCIAPAWLAREERSRGTLAPGSRGRSGRARPRPLGGPRRAGRGHDGRGPVGAQPAAMVSEPGRANRCQTAPTRANRCQTPPARAAKFAPVVAVSDTSSDHGGVAVLRTPYER